VDLGKISRLSSGPREEPGLNKKVEIREKRCLYAVFGIRIRLLSSETLRMQKKIFFIFFSYNLLAGTLSSVLKNVNFWLKFGVKILLCKHYFSPLNTFMRKREGSGSVPLTNRSGWPTNMRIRIPNTACKYVQARKKNSKIQCLKLWMQNVVRVFLLAAAGSRPDGAAPDSRICRPATRALRPG
jgi:hypothetical protein